MTFSVSFRTLAAAAAVVVGTSFVAATDAGAAGGGKSPESQSWSSDGMFGTFDRAALRRGLQVYRDVCASCHSLDLVAFRHLGQIGFSEDEIKAIASEYEVEDGPDDVGDMFTRPGVAADPFPAPFPNDAAATAAMGALPPDLSLIVKARAGGADYLHAILTGYEDEAPDGVSIPDTSYFNPYFSLTGGIAMAPPLFDEAVEYADGTPATVEQMSRDVTEFLHWAAEPDLEERKSLGLGVIIFLIVFTGLTYALKRKIWSDLH